MTIIEYQKRRSSILELYYSNTNHNGHYVRDDGMFREMKSVDDYQAKYSVLYFYDGFYRRLDKKDMIEHNSGLGFCGDII